MVMSECRSVTEWVASNAKAIVGQIVDEDAKTQEDLVLEFFESNPNESYSAEDIQRLVLPDVIITSCRRALFNLKSDGHLVETGETVIGNQGRPIGKLRLSAQHYSIRELEVIVEPIENTLEELVRLESEISTEAIEAVCSIGRKLATIHLNKLYRRAGFRSWDAYCKSNRVPFVKQQADRYIRAANLIPRLPKIPKLEQNLFQLSEWNQWQVLELDKCKDAVLVAEKAIEKAVANSQKEGGKFDLTAKLIAETRKEIEGTESEDDFDDEPEETMSFQDALRVASRCNSIDASYLAKKTALPETRIKAWLELCEDALGYKPKKLEGGKYAIVRYRIQSDKQFIADVKSRRIEGDENPVDVLSRMLDSIANTIEGVVAQYGVNCKSRIVWKELSTDTLENLHFLFTSAQSKVAEQFPVFKEMMANELLSRRQSGQELS
jgi:hypothetical protein